MFQLYTSLKTRLSTLHEDSWHARLTKFAWGKHARKTKACPYWWLIVPSSPIVAGLKLLLLVLLLGVLAGGWLLIAVFAWPCQAIAWFSGRPPYEWGVGGDKFAPYKSKLRWSKGNYQTIGAMRFAPWQYACLVLIPGLAIAASLSGWVDYGATQRAASDQASYVPGILLGAIAAIAILGLLGLAYRYKVVSLLKHAYTKWCPEVEWIHEEPEAE